MKYGLSVCLLVISLQVFSLPLSQEARQEAALFNNFLKAAYAQRHADKDRFTLLRNVLEQAPQSAYLKQQLVAEALAANALELADPYADFINEETADAQAWAVYGAYQWQKNNDAKAVEAYEKALALDPDDELILYQYITVLADSNPQKAARELEELARVHPVGAPVIYGEIGRLYAYHQDYPASLKALSKSLELNPDDGAVRQLRAGVYEKTNQYFLMLHDLEELDKRGQATAQSYAQMGAVFVMVKDLPKAKTYFLKAKELDNGNLAAGFFLSALAEQQGDYTRAISYLKETADYAQSPAKQVQVSYLQRKINQPKESFKTISNAYKQFAGNDEVAYLYAVALYEEQNYRASARVLAPLVDKHPSHQDIRLQYAFALEGQKKYVQLEEQLRTLLEQNPQNAAALNLYAYSLALRGVRLDEAQQYVARALAIMQDASFIDTQAWIFYKQGNNAQALDVLRALPEEILQTSPEIAYHAGMIYAANGQTEQAKKYLQLAADGGWKDAQKALKKMK